jgi:hypothetical protein
VKQGALFAPSALGTAVAELRRDLLAEGGPQISTMSSYRFAILVYPPDREFELRRAMRQLRDELEKSHGWQVLAVSLHRLFLDRLRSQDPALLERLISTEKRLHGKDPRRALEYLKDKLARHVEGPDGIARDVVRWIDDFVEARDPDPERTLVLLARAGALYPFFRSSALLKHIDGKTRQLPVVLLYPGTRHDASRLSFMDELPADGDYRPRVYGGRGSGGE